MTVAVNPSLHLARTTSEHRAWSATYGSNVYVHYTLIRNYVHASLQFSATIRAMQSDAALAWSHAERAELYAAADLMELLVGPNQAASNPPRTARCSF